MIPRGGRAGEMSEGGQKVQVSSLSKSWDRKAQHGDCSK